MLQDSKTRWLLWVRSDGETGEDTQDEIGLPITPQTADDLAAEAERGYDLAGAKRHRIGHAEPTASRDRRTATGLDSALWDGEDLSDDDRRAVQAAKQEAGVPWQEAAREID
jgi:hypothetical protein